MIKERFLWRRKNEKKNKNYIQSNERLLIVVKKMFLEQASPFLGPF